MSYLRDFFRRRQGREPGRKDIPRRTKDIIRHNKVNKNEPKHKRDFNSLPIENELDITNILNQNRNKLKTKLNEVLTDHSFH